MVILNISPLDNYAITCCDNYRGGDCIKIVVSSAGCSVSGNLSETVGEDYIFRK